MSVIEQLKTAIIEKSVSSVKNILKAHPHCLSTAVDGCNHADSFSEAA
jgi:hypothetical protein